MKLKISANFDFGKLNNDLDNLKFKGDQLIPVLVNAIKELSEKVTALEKV